MSLAHAPLEDADLPVNIPLGGTIGSELLGIPAGNHLLQPHDRGGKMPVPIQGHFSDIPATGPVQTLRPA